MSVAESTELRQSTATKTAETPTPPATDLPEETRPLSTAVSRCCPACGPVPNDQSSGFCAQHIREMQERWWAIRSISADSNQSPQLGQTA